MNEIMSTALVLAENAPKTGDNFPKGVLIAVVLIAIAAAIGTAVLAKNKNDDDK